MRTVTRLVLEVEHPADVTPQTVADVVCSQLDEPPCDWGDWSVGAVQVQPPGGEDDADWTEADEIVGNCTAEHPCPDRAQSGPFCRHMQGPDGRS